MDTMFPFSGWFLLIAIALWFLLRDLMCWYYKINKIVKIQQAMLQAMAKLLEQQGGEVDWDNLNKLLK